MSTSPMWPLTRVTYRRMPSAKMKALMEAIVEALQDSIGSIDFWHNTDKQKKSVAKCKTALTLTGIAET